MLFTTTFQKHIIICSCSLSKNPFFKFITMLFFLFTVFIECDGSQIDCAICLQPCVHPTVLPCGHIFCYLCVKGLGRTTRMCAMCRREFPQDLIENPHLLRPVESTHDAGFEDGHQWFYEGRNGASSLPTLCNHYCMKCFLH